MSTLLVHTDAVVQEDGVVVLKGLPVHKGQHIEVSVYTKETSVEEAEDPMTLRSEPLHDEDPFDPVAADDWESLQ